MDKREFLKTSGIFLAGTVLSPLGSGEQALGCGVQKPRQIMIDYIPKADAKLGTAGIVAGIDVPRQP